MHSSSVSNALSLVPRRGVSRSDAFLRPRGSLLRESLIRARIRPECHGFHETHYPLLEIIGGGVPRGEKLIKESNNFDHVCATGSSLLFDQISLRREALRELFLLRLEPP